MNEATDIQTEKNQGDCSRSAAGSSASDVYESLDKEAWEIVGVLANYGSRGHWDGDVEKLMLRANEWRAKVRQAMPTNQ